MHPDSLSQHTQARLSVNQMSHTRWSHHNRMKKSYWDWFKVQNRSHASELYWSLMTTWPHSEGRLICDTSWPLQAPRTNFTGYVRECFLLSLGICILHFYWLLTQRHVWLHLILCSFFFFLKQINNHWSMMVLSVLFMIPRDCRWDLLKWSKLLQSKPSLSWPLFWQKMDSTLKFINEHLILDPACLGNTCVFLTSNL